VSSDPDVAAAGLNLVGSYRKLVEHVPGADMRAFGSVIGFATGLPVPTFNGIMVLEPTGPADVEQALDWIGRRAVPYAMWVREELAIDVLDLAAKHGLVMSAWRSPAMVLSPVPASPAPPGGVSVRLVDDHATLADYLRAQTDGGVPDQLARRLCPPSLVADPEARVFTGYLGDRAVGTSIAIRTGAVSGVYNVSTLPEARRRGVGAAVTWAAVGAGREWGCDPIVLDSSAMGERVYSAMGFRTVTRYVIFRPAVIADPARS
jgi:GNAT superfamily N-acetyltransferase